jgi:hypothetical protein
MFTFKKSPRGEEVTLGDEGQLADYYLNFYKGRYLVTVTSLDRGKLALAGLLALARSVEARIKENGTRPRLVDILPEEGLQPGSLLFFRGPLAVFNHESALAAAAAGAESGAMGRYLSGLTIVILDYPSRDLALTRLAGAKAGLIAPASSPRSTAGEPGMTAQDARGRWIAAQVEGEHAVFVLGGRGRDEAKAKLAGVVLRIRTYLKRR